VLLHTEVEFTFDTINQKLQKMKKLYTLIFCLCAMLPASAQFSIDTLQPMNFCSITGSIEQMQIIKHPTNGYFAFWRAKPSGGQFKLYGQRFDDDGNPQWTAGGKLIVSSVTQSVVGYQCTLFDGGILVTWRQAPASFGDSLFCKKINYSGNNLWTQPTLIATGGVSPILSIEDYGIRAIPNDSGAFINYSVNYFGGLSGIQFHRIDFNGVLQWASPKTQSLPGYVFYTKAGLQNTFYSISQGNGLGSGIYIQKYNMQSVAQWPAPVDVSQGVSSNGAGGTHNLMADNNGNIYFVWESANSRVSLTKMNSSGNFVWTPNIKQTVSLANTTQSRMTSVYNNNNLFIAWLDNRISGQSTIYTQKYNTSGAAQWTANGVQTAVCNGYYSYPKVAISDSGSVFCNYNFNDVTGEWKVAGQRIRSNGSLTWSDNGKVMASGNSAFLPYDVNRPVDDANGCNAVFWMDNSNGNLFGAKLCSNGMLVNINEPDVAGNNFSVFPNPASDDVTIHFDENQQTANTTLSLWDMQGKLLYSIEVKNNREVSVSIGDYAPGIYLIRVTNGIQSSYRKLVIQ